MEFIKFNENQKIWYFGACKITINTILKQLIVEPINNEQKMMSADFCQNIIQQKNYLFIFSTNQQKALDFILISTKQESCRKVLETIQKYHIPNNPIGDAFDQRMFKTNILLPLLDELRRSQKLTSQNDLDALSKLFRFLEKLTSKNKSERGSMVANTETGKVNPKLLMNLRRINNDSNYLENRKNNENDNNLCNAHENNKPEYESLNNSDEETFRTFSNTKSLRKRSAININYSENNDSEDIDASVESESRKPLPKRRKLRIPSTNSEENIESPHFELKFFKKNGIENKRLIIFTNSTERKYCYEFYFDNRIKFYICCGCNRMNQKLKAQIFKNDKNEKDFVKLRTDNHICQPREYFPEKFMDDEIIYKPNYDIIKSSYRGVTKEKLIIFVCENKKLYYEFSQDPYKRHLCCTKCRTKKLCIQAKICIDNIGTEYASLGHGKHLCEPKDSEIDKLNAAEEEKIDVETTNLSNKIIEAPLFEKITFTRNEITKKFLLIFLDENKKLCYEYYFHADQNYYRCCGCMHIGNKTSSAKICRQDSNGKEFVQIGVFDHICQPREYNSDKFKSDEIIFKPNFEVVKYSYRGISKQKLIIYLTNDKKAWNEYFHDSKKDYYCCLKCGNKNVRIRATLGIDENGNEYVGLNPTMGHICDPITQKTPENKIIELPNYEIYQKLQWGKMVDRLKIFIDNSKTLGYEYSWQKREKLYYCVACNNNNTKNKKRVIVSARIIKNKIEEKEYIELNTKAHICNPINFITQSNNSKSHVQRKNVNKVSSRKNNDS